LINEDLPVSNLFSPASTNRHAQPVLASPAGHYKRMLPSGSRQQLKEPTVFRNKFAPEGKKTLMVHHSEIFTHYQPPLKLSQGSYHQKKRSENNIQVINKTSILSQYFKTGPLLTRKTAEKSEQRPD
jgi:hypothetical protein